MYEYIRLTNRLLRLRVSWRLHSLKVNARIVLEPSTVSEFTTHIPYRIGLYITNKADTASLNNLRNLKSARV